MPSFYSNTSNGGSPALESQISARRRQQMNQPQPVANTGGNLPPVVQPPQIQPPNPYTGGTIPPLPTNYINTGGNTPPSLYTAATGGNNPPSVVPTTSTGGTLPPVATSAPPTGGNLPPTQVPPVPPAPTPPVSNGLEGIVGNDYVATPTGGTDFIDYNSPAANVRDPNQAYNDVTGNLNQLLSTDSPYIQNAVNRGLEYAASRGLRNSSIAAGAAQRSAIEGAMPILNQVQQLGAQREGLEFQGQQSQFDRELQNIGQQNQFSFQAGQSALDRTQGVNQQILQAKLTANQASIDNKFKTFMQDRGVQQQDWLASQDYSRQVNATLSNAQIQSSQQLFSFLQQAAINDPETFTPAILSGMANFNGNIMAQFWDDYFGNGGG